MAIGYDARPTRRGMLDAGAAITAAAALPTIPATAQAPRWRRYNVASPQGQAMLRHYQTAIAAMLALPASDPRNWYRIAFTHFLDCPHGNWWLFPWHRGFTGWVEQIVRQFSGFPDFAFPYWDWTASPQVPAAMASGLLNPANPAFIATIPAFAAKFKGSLTEAGYWREPPQRVELQQRNLGSEADVWSQIENAQDSNYPVFFPATGYPNVRNPNPVLDCVAGPAVAPPIIAAAMASQDYATFSSPPAPDHSKVVGFALLEGSPHNKVHNNTGGIVYSNSSGQCDLKNPANIGGIMQAFLSPADPLFFLHHSNIDRLWSAWTQKQQAAGRPTLPQGAAYTTWASEPFLFFCNAAGHPVTPSQAGNYATIGSFAYDYQPGSVGDVGVGDVGVGAKSLVRGRPPVRRFVGVALPVKAAVATTVTQGASAVRLEPALLALTRPRTAQTLIAKVTLTLPPHRRGQVFPVYVDAGGPGGGVMIGTVSLFGHAMAHGPLVFTLPLDAAIATLRQANALKSGAFLRFRAESPADAVSKPGTATAHMDGMAMGDQIGIPIESVVIEAH